jgi:ribonucleotide reductase beta subunit family protein with ferritin-like domain
MRDKSRMMDTIDTIRYICRDLLMHVFHKQMDHLKTNYKVIHYDLPHQYSSLSIRETLPLY